jgi:hypothetical protein
MTKEQLMAMGLTDEQAAKVMEAHKAELDGSFVTKTRFNEVNAELGAAKEAAKERDGQLEALKKSSGDIDGMKKEIAELQEKNKASDEAHAAEVKALKVGAAVDAALAAAKAKNMKAAKALLELEKPELAEDGTVKGLAEQIKKLAAADDSKFLFEEAGKKPTIKGAKPAETGTEEPDGKVDYAKMSYEEIAAYMEANPGAAT